MLALNFKFNAIWAWQNSVLLDDENLDLSDIDGQSVSDDGYHPGTRGKRRVQGRQATQWHKDQKKNLEVLKWGGASCTLIAGSMLFM